jgi:hypothetical protein
LEDQHNLVLNICKERPTRIWPTVNPALDADGRVKCHLCDHTATRTLAEHYAVKFKPDLGVTCRCLTRKNALSGCRTQQELDDRIDRHFTFMSNKGLPLVVRPTANQQKNTQLIAAGLTFPTEANLQPLTLGEEKITQTATFKYLGRILSNDNRDEAAVRARINLAQATFIKMHRKYFQQRHISTETKLAVYNAVIRAQVLYGCETTTPSKRALEALDRRHMQQLRNISGLLPFKIGQSVRPPTTTTLPAAAAAAVTPAPNAGPPPQAPRATTARNPHTPAPSTDNSVRALRRDYANRRAARANHPGAAVATAATTNNNTQNNNNRHNNTSKDNSLLRYPKTSLVLKTCHSGKLSDQVKLAQLRLLGHILRRPPSSDLRFLLHSQLPGNPTSCRGFFNYLKLSHAFRTRMMEAGLTEEVALSRTAWRKKGNAWYNEKKQTAQSPGEKREGGLLAVSNIRAPGDPVPPP